MKTNIKIGMRNNNSYLDMKFHELDVLLSLREIKPSKAAGHDDIHEMLLKKCSSTG